MKIRAAKKINTALFRLLDAAALVCVEVVLMGSFNAGYLVSTSFSVIYLLLIFVWDLVLVSNFDR